MKYCILIIFMSFSAWAKQQNGPPQGWSLGAVTFYRDSPYVGMKNRFWIFPSVSYVKGSFAFRGFSLSYDLFKDKKFRFGTMLIPMFFLNQLDPKESPELYGMDERKGTIDYGFYSRYRLKFVQFKIRYFKDILGRHNGGQFRLALGSQLPLNIFFKEKFPFTLISLDFVRNYYSESIVNYYFGVKQTEVNSNRRAYQTTDTWTTIISTFIRINIEKKTSLILRFEREWLSNEITNSPIVKEDVIHRTFLGISYSIN